MSCGFCKRAMVVSINIFTVMVQTLVIKEEQLEKISKHVLEAVAS